MIYEFSGKTIPELFFQTAEKHGARKALIVNHGDGTLYSITYSELQQSVIALSSFIRRTGFKSGDHIALLGANSPEWATSYLAIQTAGCVVVPLDSAQRPQELRHIIRHSDTAAIFLAEKYICVLQDEEGEHFPDMPYFRLENLDSFIETEKNSLPAIAPSDDESPAVLIYTSGTTGSQKGVILTHRNIVSDIAGMVPLFPFTPNDTFLSVLPVHHAFEATCGFLTPISIGCGICYARALRAKEILEDITASNATIMLGVPLLFEKFYTGIKRAVKNKGVTAKTIFGTAIGITALLDKVIGGRSGKKLMSAFRKKAGFGNMWLMISGGAPIRPDVVQFFNRFGIVFVQGYGLTETSPVLSVSPLKSNKPASVGPAIAAIELKINNPDNNGIGEVIVKGASVFAQYYKNPEATAEVITPDGWFRTGDLGRIDEDGYLFLVGRAKNLIVTAGGKNVHPEEIEEKLNESEFIMESLVVGNHGEKGEEPFAIVVPDYDVIDDRFGDSWTEKQVESLIRGSLGQINSQIALYKRIKGFKIQSEEFPKTSTRKIKRYLYRGKEIEF